MEMVMTFTVAATTLNGRWQLRPALQTHRPRRVLAAGSCKLRANILTIVFVDATGLQHSNSKEPESSI
jgi:hypothetical protein